MAYASSPESPCILNTPQLLTPASWQTLLCLRSVNGQGRAGLTHAYIPSEALCLVVLAAGAGCRKSGHLSQQHLPILPQGPCAGRWPIFGDKLPTAMLLTCLLSAPGLPQKSAKLDAKPYPGAARLFRPFLTPDSLCTVHECAGPRALGKTPCPAAGLPRKWAAQAAERGRRQAAYQSFKGARGVHCLAEDGRKVSKVS